MAEVSSTRLYLGNLPRNGEYWLATIRDEAPAHPPSSSLHVAAPRVAG